jgi:2-methylcitrate dehydratase
MAMNAHEEPRSPPDAIQAYLARYSSELTYERLTPEVVHAAKVRIVDTLGVLVAGLDGEPCRIARTLAAEVPHANGATLLGTRIKAPVEMAAYANGTTARFAELTDMYHWPGSAYGHPSDVVAPLASVAEFVNASGRDLIAAVVLAYEIFCRFSDVFHNRGFDPSNFACIGIAMATGKLLGLRADELSHCVALAVTPNVILRQVRVDDLTMYKVAAAGHAARAGVFAARLAQAGMEGPHLPFVGRAGWCSYVAGEQLVLSEFGGEGTPFKIGYTQLKFRPCAGNTISSVLAAEKLGPLEHSGDVKQVIVEVYDRAKIASASAPHFWNPQSAETADHSIPYLVAVALLDGTLSRQSYDDAHLWSPRVRELMSKIEVVENDAFSKAYEGTPQAHRTRVAVEMQNGETRIAESGGDADDVASPKSDAQVSAKFHALTEAHLGRERADALLERLWHLERTPDVARLASMFAPG